MPHPPPNSSISPNPEAVELEFAYRFCKFVLPLASVAVVIGALTVPFTYAMPDRLWLLLACGVLFVLYESLRRFGLPRIKSLWHLNAMAAGILVPGGLINAAGMSLAADSGATAGTIGIMLAAALLFHSTGMFLLVMVGTFASWLLVASTFGGPPIAHVTHLGVVAPSLALAMRWAARKAYDELVDLRTREHRLLQELQANMSRLRDEEASRATADRLLYQAQRHESLGLLAGGVAHDFNNFLLAIIAFTESLLSGKEPLHHRDTIEEIKRTALSAADVCQQMLTYSGEAKDVRAPADVTALIGELRPLIKASLPKAITLDFQFGPRATVLMHKGRVRQAVMNVVLNAAESMPRGGTIRISTAEVRLPDQPSSEPGEMLVGELKQAKRYFCVRVSDEGSGLKPEVAARIFEPYFTTKARGHGFGLAVTLGILQGHGGGVRVLTGSHPGTVVELILPEADAAIIPDETATKADRPAQAHSVLVVDDEPFVRKGIAAMLKSMGCSVVTADSGRAALDELSKHAGDVDIAILDYSMPQMDGLEVLRQIRRSYPKLPVVLSSGFMMSRDEDSEAPDAFLAKPYTVSKLREVMHEVTARPQSSGTRTPFL